MDNETVKLELVSGCEGKSIYIDDYRVAGSKPWGGGRTEKEWTAKRENILKALGIEIMRIDFEEGYTNSDGDFIDGMTEEITILYNKRVIRYEEVCELINSGEYRYDNRIVVTTPTQADNLRGKRKDT